MIYIKKYNGNNGHRQRLRKRFTDSGTGAFAPHEMLELFLQISIPRRDTKLTAKRLIENFGSVSGALSADKAALTEINGVGERTAQLFEIYKKIENQQAGFEYPSYENGFEQYAAKITENDVNKEFYFAVTDGCDRVLYCRRIFDGSSELLGEYFSEIARTAVRRNGSEIYLFQHRPSHKTLKFYDEDIRTVSALTDFLEEVGVGFADFIIICSDSFCSYNAQNRRTGR